MSDNMGEAAEAVVEAEASMFGMLDIFVLSGVAGFAIYWFVIRKKQDDPVQQIKKLTVAATPARSESYDPSFINKMKRTGRNVVVFYGSQTGTAEEFAGRLAKDASRYGLKGMPADPEECEMDDLAKLSEIENSLVIFCMATYGEGDPTDNCQDFHDWLQNGTVDLTGVKFAVFSLGNKTYEHFNAMGKYVDKRMEELGATRVHENGIGDDDANIEEDFVTWREKFWPAVCEHYNISAVGDDISCGSWQRAKTHNFKWMKITYMIPFSKSMRQYTLATHEDDEYRQKLFTGEPVRIHSFNKQKPPYDSKNPYLAPIKVNRELHKGGDRSCMHIEFDIFESKIRYDAGDHVAVYPVNDPLIVEAIGKRLNVDLDQMFTLNNVDEEASKKHPFPCPTTYRTALSHYLDVIHPPRTNVLKELMEYAGEQKDKDLLEKLTAPTPEAKEFYNEWVVKDQRNILAVLDDLPSVQPPIDHMCELLPRLQARYYSISSSPKVHPTTIHVTAVLIDYKTRTGRRQQGVATSWLKLKHPAGDEKPIVPIFVRKSQFRLPFKPSVPIIMVGPGTGLAPFRGFVQDRSAMKKDGKAVGKAVLYFGCRHKAEDFIYEDEMNDYASDGIITQMHLAFSRDGAEKVYVQHLMKQNQEELYKLLYEEGAHIYVCGDARSMAHDVDNALKEALMNEGKLDENSAHDYLKKLRTRGRYSCDVWS